MKKEHQGIIEKAYQCFAACPDPGKRGNEGGWSVKEVIGHLIDSASNNHQRLARYEPNNNFTFPGYDQERFVTRAAYDTLEYNTLLALWQNYNKLLLHMIDCIPESHAESTITVGSGPQMTIGQLINSYFDHIALHLAQVEGIVDG